jgi:transcriptional regulator with XRE-family HTH domain
MLSHAFGSRRYAVAEYFLMLRSRARLTQSELGMLIGVHRRSVQKWECGEAYPGAEHLRSLIAVYLARGNFTSGCEREEAEVLWRMVSEEAPQALPHFDSTWYATLRLHAVTPVFSHGNAKPQAPQQNIYTLSSERGKATAPMQRTSPVTPPLQPTSFVGRSVEVVAIQLVL